MREAPVEAHEKDLLHDHITSEKREDISWFV
jgi:hypothetical protein